MKIEKNETTITARCNTKVKMDFKKYCDKNGLAFTMVISAYLEKFMKEKLKDASKK